MRNRPNRMSRNDGACLARKRNVAIAKAILEAHRAHYGVESKLNEGSTFWFELDKDYDDEE